ncbi:hypothetical protein JOC55_000248 [Paenibacillus sacheonensis]|nr:hypothetical protein [Paenibacillus sacheonensis]
MIFFFVNDAQARTTKLNPVHRPDFLRMRQL